MSSNRLAEEFRRRLNGRTKQALIEEMIVRSPHNIATEKMVKALEVFPLLILMLAADHPTKIWILDRGETPSSAEILDEAARNRRWHNRGICIDECEGITDVVDNYVAVVVSWKTLLVMRHEFAHAATTFLAPNVRKDLERLYLQARERRAFVEPLAAESLGEYVACAMSYYYFSDLADELRQIDPELYNLIDKMFSQAEAVSREIALAPIATQTIPTGASAPAPTPA
jgi:hypothetical protein